MTDMPSTNLGGSNSISGSRPRHPVPSNYNPTFNKQDRSDFAQKLLGLLKTSSKLRNVLGQVAAIANELHFGLKDVKRGKVWDGLKDCSLTDDIDLVARSYLQLAQTLNAMNAASVHTFDGPLHALATSYVGTFSALDKEYGNRVTPFLRTEKKLFTQLKSSQSLWSRKGSAADAERLMTDLAVAKSHRTACYATYTAEVYAADIASINQLNFLTQTQFASLRTALVSTLAGSTTTTPQPANFFNNNPLPSGYNNINNNINTRPSYPTTLFNTPIDTSPQTPISELDASKTKSLAPLSADALASSLLELDFSPRRWSPSPSDEGSSEESGLLTPVTLDRDHRAASASPVLQLLSHSRDITLRDSEYENQQRYHNQSLQSQQLFSRRTSSLSRHSGLVNVPMLSSVEVPRSADVFNAKTRANGEVEQVKWQQAGQDSNEDANSKDALIMQESRTARPTPDTNASIDYKTRSFTVAAADPGISAGGSLESFPLHSRSSSAIQRRPSLKSALRSSSASFTNGSDAESSAGQSETFQKQRSASTGGAGFGMRRDNTVDSTTNTMRRKMVHFTNPGRPMVEFWDCSDSKICADRHSAASDSGTEDAGAESRPALTSSEKMDTGSSTSINGTGVSAKIKDVNVLRSLYPNMFVPESVSRISTKPVQHMQDVFFQENEQQKRVGPAVYFPPQADIESEVGSVVGEDSMSPNRMKLLVGKDLVFALYKYVARDGKEMSFEKGEVVEVYKRAGNWIYGAKVTEIRNKETSEFTNWQSKRQSTVGLRHPSSNTSTSSLSSSSSVVTREVGWIPASFVSKYSLV
ncbi:hypothetical protein BDR26DRAFT_850422 [Obelidium mucronatum]|nr:hypothetical protein BDR26DRAFT_850422 [Obelidium mucronatum]